MARLADAVAGAPILASWHNTNRDRTLVPETSAAARNTDIPAPTAGMLVYLQDSHVVQVYNGTAWVTVTPQSAVTGANEATTGATYAALGTAGPVVTLETGTSALVIVSYLGSSTGSGVGAMGFAVSGATTLAAADTRAGLAFYAATGEFYSVSKSVYVTGLTAGANTFTSQYKRFSGAGSVFFQDRTITVVGVP